MIKLIYLNLYQNVYKIAIYFNDLIAPIQSENLIVIGYLFVAFSHIVIKFTRNPLNFPYSLQKNNKI